MQVRFLPIHLTLIGEFSPVGNRKREDMGMDKNDSLGMCIAKIIGCVILICLIASFSRSCSRSDRNMVLSKRDIVMTMIRK